MDGMWDGDNSMALKYYKVAADQGNIEAMKYLGQFLDDAENPLNIIKWHLKKVMSACIWI